jgi:general secretion pathway protein E
MISGNLDSIIAQRLIRKLCSHCKIPHTEFSEIELEILEKYQNLMPSNPQICKPAGCVHCRNTGYRGRTTIAEILHVTPEIDNAILEEATKHKIIAIAKEQGFRTLQEDAMHRVFEGAVALEEIRMSVNLI